MRRRPSYFARLDVLETIEEGFVMTSRVSVCVAIFFLTVGVSVANAESPTIDFSSLSDEQMRSLSEYGYPYTVEQARKFGYSSAETDRRKISDLSNEQLREMAFGGDRLAQQVYMQNRLLPDEKFDEALAIAMERAARYGHTDLLNLFGFVQLDISRTNAFIYYALAARFGDPQSIQMRNDLARHIGNESSGEGDKRAELLYENIDSRRRQLSIE